VKARLNVNNGRPVQKPIQIKAKLKFAKPNNDKITKALSPALKLKKAVQSF